MKIAIIGGGISGLTTAYFLHAKHEIVLYEANDYVGGHTNTIDVETDAGWERIDTGFIVFNHDTYPNFTRLLQRLEIESQPTTMSFSIKNSQSGLEYRGADLNGIFAQRRNLTSPKFYRLLYDFLRFNRHSKLLLQDKHETMTVGEYLARENFSEIFINSYFLPMGSAVWSCPRGTFENFPIRFIVEFYKNHGMLAVKDRPQWRVIRGGSKSYVDALWAYGVGVVTLFFVWGTTSGNEARKWFVSALAVVWSVRLGSYILLRVATMPEDGRYQMIKESWKTNKDWKMFRFYQYQAMASVLFAVPMLIAAQSEAPFGLLDSVGLIVGVAAILGESIADFQLHTFRSDPSNQGKVLRKGLWRYSRHPNYFFEWLHWWAYVFFAIHAPLFVLSLVGPIFMLLFITRITGVRPTEQQATRTRGEKYLEYQKATSPFFPWPPKQLPIRNE